MTVVLRLDRVSKVFGSGRGWFGRSRRPDVRAVSEVSLTLETGGRVGLVGESGSGKTTTARLILGLTRASAGRIELAGRDVTALTPEDEGHIHRSAQIVFQDPLSSLNPKKSVQQIVMLPLIAQKIGTTNERLERVKELLDQVGLPQRYRNSLPDRLSGGQRQRVGIARALAINPQLLVLDEPTASLDVSVQARVLALLDDLQRSLGIAQIMVSHNLGVIRHVADKVAVMYLGRIVEQGSTAQIFSAPAHPYTQALFSAIPVIDPSERASLPQRPEVKGEVTSAAHIPNGCAFHPRCTSARAECSNVVPQLKAIADGHQVSCHLYP
ncbi:MAG: ABC transporter ATP-binding protein [Alphaproteobacteria bacterium]|nr:ABC transporter ATP-binding protein [Alphaproteobacteria bacterium]